MSKTFESIDHTRQLHVKPLDNHVTLVINYKDAGRSGLTISHSDAPALCLAILRAAGAHKDSQDYLGGAVEQLIFHIATTEREAAAEADRVKLEEEALELFNTSQGINLKSWGSTTDRSVISIWVKVAKRARELNKETTND